jgi:hypothetical protein
MKVLPMMVGSAGRAFVSPMSESADRPRHRPKQAKGNEERISIL